MSAKRILSLSLAVTFISTLAFDLDIIKYIILMLVPWAYLLSGVQIYRPDGVIVFFYYLYSISYPTFLILIGGSTDLSRLLDTTNIAYAGIFSAVAFFYPGNKFTGVPKFNAGFSKFLGFISFSLLPVTILCAVLLIVQSGLGSKREINDAGGLLSYLNLGVYALFVYSSIYICYLIASRKSYLAQSFCLFLLGLTYLLLVGERDILFRYLFVVGIFWVSITGIFRSYYYLLGFIFILGVVSLSQQMKNLLLTGSLYDARETGLAWLFYNDFISGSRNLHQVIIFGKGESGVDLIWGDFLRFFNGFGIVDDVKSATQWYNEEYRHTHKFSGESGWGFSIVAEFYYTYGNIAVFSGMFILMSVTNILYKCYWSSVVGRVFMILFYAAFIYSFRSDLSNFMGLTIKWGAIIIIVSNIAYLVLLSVSKGYVWPEKVRKV